MHRSLINGWKLSKLKPPQFYEFTEWWKKKHPIPFTILHPSISLACCHDNGTEKIFCVEEKKNSLHRLRTMKFYFLCAVRKMENFCDVENGKMKDLENLEGIFGFRLSNFTIFVIILLENCQKSCGDYDFMQLLLFKWYLDISVTQVVWFIPNYVILVPLTPFWTKMVLSIRLLTKNFIFNLIKGLYYPK